MISVFDSVLNDQEIEAVCSALGGLNVYFGKTKESRENLYRDLNEDLVDRLCELFTGETVYIPNLKAVNAQRRKKKIIDLHKQGVKTNELAKQFNVSTRWISKIVSTSK